MTEWQIFFCKIELIGKAMGINLQKIWKKSPNFFATFSVYFGKLSQITFTSQKLEKNSLFLW